MKILITNSTLRKTFDVYNIVRRHVRAKNIIISNCSFVFSFMVYGKKCYQLRQDSYINFELDLKRILKAFAPEDIIYLPVEESTTILLLKFLEKNNYKNLKYLLPEYSSFELARDKYKLNEFCLKENIPAPKMFTKQQIKKIEKNKTFIPVICKPRIGSGAEGIIIIDSPAKIDNLALFNDSEYVIQEFLPNSKEVFGSFFLMNKGNLVVAYGHKRIRTFPVQGGVTVYSELKTNDEIINIGTKLLKKLNWSGFAMIEFLKDPKNNTYDVIEINPRLWGSVLLSEFCGANFLNNYIQLSLGNKVKPIVIIPEKKIRWFIFDILNLFNGDISLSTFFKLNKKDTCYINATYSTWWSILWFHFFFFFNKDNIKKLILKWKRK